MKPVHLPAWLIPRTSPSEVKQNRRRH